MRATQFAYAFSNQFELPVLFYVLTILSIITHHADLVFVVLAWIFVIFRVLQAYVHVTSNNVALARRLLWHRRVGAGRDVGHLHRPHPARIAMSITT